MDKLIEKDMLKVMLEDKKVKIEIKKEEKVELKA